MDCIGEQETLDNYSEYQGKTEHFWYLEQASKTCQVLEAKSSLIENSLSGPSKQEIRVNLIKVPRTCFMFLGITFKVDG